MNHVIIRSPMTVPEFKEVIKRLEPIMGNSSLVVTLAFSLLTGNDNTVYNEISNMVRYAPRDMVYLYSQSTGLPLESVGKFISSDIQFAVQQAIEFFKLDPTVSGLLNLVKTNNVSMVVYQVVDGVDTPYIVLRVT